MARHPVAKAGDVPAGEGRCVQAGGKELALFHVDGKYYAIDNECPHVGGPLGEGTLEGMEVVCPLHRWTFDLVTGQCSRNAKVKVNAYPAGEEDGSIWVEV